MRPLGRPQAHILVITIAEDEQMQIHREVTKLRLIASYELNADANAIRS